MDDSRGNRQTTDSVCQVNSLVLGDAPSQSIATLYQTSAASTGIAIQNAVSAQNNQNAISTAATAEALSLLLGSPTAATAAAPDAMQEVMTRRLSELTEMLERLKTAQDSE